MKKIIYFSTIVSIMLLTACNKEQATPVTMESSALVSAVFDFESVKQLEVQIPDVPVYTGPVYGDELTVETRGNTYEVYPGTNQLQDIINNADWGDKIVLMEGIHQEDETVVINRRIRLRGEEGAVLSLGGAVGLFVYDARKTSIKDLEITNGGASAFGVMVEETNKFEMEDNYIHGFLFSIVLEEAWKAKIKDNVIVGADTTPNVGGHGITHLNGNKAEFSGNEISGHVLGIWACDLDGKAKENETHGNFIGFVLCKVPTGALTGILMGGTGGSVNPATNWKVEDNNSYNNVWGYLVVDGAKDNELEDNEGHNNSFVDIELAGETNQLFGFFTPPSEGNEVDAGDLRYIDCGVDNEVEGGIESGVDCSL